MARSKSDGRLHSAAKVTALLAPAIMLATWLLYLQLCRTRSPVGAHSPPSCAAKEVAGLHEAPSGPSSTSRFAPSLPTEQSAGTFTGLAELDSFLEMYRTPSERMEAMERWSLEASQMLLRDAHVQETFFAALHDRERSRDSRIAIALTLGRTRDDRMRRRLAEIAHGDDDGWLAAVIVDALLESDAFGPSTQPYQCGLVPRAPRSPDVTTTDILLRMCASDSGVKARERAAEAIGTYRPPYESLPDLLDLLLHSSAHPEIGSWLVAGAMHAAAGHPEGRASMIRAFGEILSKGAAQSMQDSIVVALSDEPDPRDTSVIAAEYARTSSVQARKVWAWTVRYSAEKWPKEVPQGIPRTIGEMARIETNEANRALLLGALGEMRSIEATDILLENLMTATPSNTRLEAARQLARSGVPEARAATIRVLLEHEQDPGIKDLLRQALQQDRPE